MRGSVLDLIIVFVILGITMFGLVMGLKIYNAFVDSDAWPTTAVGNSTSTAALASLDVINYGMLFLAVGLVVTLIVSAFFIETHPIFFIVSIVLLLVVVVVSAPITNAFMEIATSDSLATESAQYDIATHVIGNIPLIAVVGGFLVIIALYAKPGGGGV